MVFSSITFLFYFLPLFFLTFALTGFSKNALLIFSLIFYAWGEPVFIPLMLAMMVVNHRLGLLIERAEDPLRRRRWLAAGVIVNLLPLIVFKYSAFLLHGILDVLGRFAVSKFGIAPDHVTFNNIPLPLGISFYTFHALSYLIDVYRRDVRAERSLRDLAVYISMFPQMIAGPIIRYKTIAGELHHPIVSLERAALGIRIFVIGLSQKVLIANTVAASADQIFALPPEQLSTSLSWIGTVCYTLQIYYDFGGYSNMAIGLGLMIGFTYPINFHYPYVANSMTDFWRRWHISLSSWFRDYVYVPLGGNRISSGRTYLNLCIVFLLCGLWHGAAWNFVVWGGAHGALLVIERAGLGRVLQRSPMLVRHAYVLLAVMATWVVFRSDTLGGAVNHLLTMIGMGAETTAPPPVERFVKLDVVFAIVVGILAAGPWGATWMSLIGERLRVASIRVGELVSVAVLFVLVTLSLAGGAYNPFIYFRF
jgi:alginate O-acetyltransferase complex protein AlgI